jgi:heme exporter protein C
MDWIQRNGRVLAVTSLLLLAIGGYLALVWSPPDVDQGDAMRILYLHVPSVAIAYLSFFIVLVSSIMYLWKRLLKWDRLASSAAELGVLFTALTLAAGSTWAKPIWGVWWTWDPRLTTTAILFVIYVGYLMLRALQVDRIARARQSAVVGIIGFVDIPVIHMSVLWWRSLHQKPTFSGMGSPTMDGRMEIALVANLIAFGVLFLFLLGQRLRVAALEDERDVIVRNELLWEDPKETQRV